jgi:serine protease Do
MSMTRRFRMTTLVAVALAALALGTLLPGGLWLAQASAAEQASPAAAPAVAATAGLPSFADLAERVIPSVISVMTTDVISRSDMRRYHRDIDPFEFFFGPNGNPNMMRPQVRKGAGSGFFISSDGLALTNNHVVEGAEKIQVRLSADDNTLLPAKVVGRDPATDLALIKVEGKGPFVPLTLGDSSALRVGDWVMAVGNPLNMAHTVTVGVVSAKGRQLGLSPETQSFENFIQTDAAINLGNSGGPLVNLRGEVVGINAAINAAGQNIGFAIPVNIVKSVLPQLKENGKVVRGYLGVSVQNVDQDIQDAFNLPSRTGAFVQSVEETGPAGKAGVQKGDTIVAVNGTPVKETRALIDTISAIPPEHKVELEVIRDGKRKSVTVTLGARPDATGEESEPGGESTSPSSKLGFDVEELSDRVRRGYEIPSEIDGVVVTNVDSASAADDAGLRQGDVITEVSGKPVGSVHDLSGHLQGLHSGTAVRLYVYRPQAERSTFIIIRVP